MAVREGASGRRRATPGDRAPMDDDGGHGPEADMMTAVVPDDSKPDLGDAPVFVREHIFIPLPSRHVPKAGRRSPMLQKP